MLKQWVLFLLTPFAFANTPTPTEVTPNNTESNTVEQTGIWIDVRTETEFEAGHLPNAIHVPHEQIADKIASITTNKDEPIHLYCRSGSRAQSALRTLKDLGYTNVINHGGYEALVNP